MLDFSNKVSTGDTPHQDFRKCKFNKKDFSNHRERAQVRHKINIIDHGHKSRVVTICWLKITEKKRRYNSCNVGGCIKNLWHSVKRFIYAEIIIYRES